MPPVARGVKPKARAVRDQTMEPTGPMPMAILGHSLFLPQGIHGGEKLFELVRAKRQVNVHREVVNYPPKMVMDTTGDGSSWKYRVDYGNYFTKDEVLDTDKKLFRIGEKEAQFMQPSQCWTLEAVFRAIENAGIKLEQLQGTRTGVFVAAFTNQPQLRSAPDETSIRGTPMSSMADKVAFYLGTHGPSMTTETACSSSITVLSQAVSFIRKGDCDTAIVVGSNPRSWSDYLVQMQALGVMSPRGLSNPFDEVADGMGRAEAYGCMIIRRMDLAEMAQDNILATLVNACAGHAGSEDDVIEGSGRVYEAPCAPGIKKIVQMCYEQANVPLEHVRYIETHATGTPVGDLIELDGISRALRDHHHAVYNPIRVASVKGNVGHAETAAGMISLIKVLGMLKHKIFLPSGGLSKPRQDFEWAANAMVPMIDEEPFPEHEPVYIGINSFGLGGAYGHAILTSYKPNMALRQRSMLSLPLSSPRSLTAHDDQEAYHILPLSAASEAHLTLYESALADYLESQCQAADQGGVAEEAKSVDGKLLTLSSPSSSGSLSPSRRPVSPAQLLRDVCGTMWCHRSSMRYRRAYVASDVSDLVTQLRSESKESNVSVVDPSMSKKDASNGVALVFTGQGAQWKGCGDRLVNRFPIYRRAVEAVDAIFTKVAGWSLRERAATLSKEELMQTQYAQPYTFMVQVGLTELIKSFNLRVTIAVGHSAGEVPAAYAAGKLSLEQAVKLVYHRSQLQQRLAGSGRMLVVGLSASETAEVLDKAGSVAAHVYVACLNSAQSTVLAGREIDLRRVDALLPDGTFKAWVAGNIAFHCPLVEPILQDMHTQLSPFLPADPVQEAAPGEEGQAMDASQVLSMLRASGSASEEESDVTFISTLTGDVYEGPVSPAYWLRNVREAVQFQGAVETLLRLPDCPKYVIEVGPHKTLLAPLLQTAQAVGGDKGFTTALSTLKRGEADDAMFMHMLAKLFEAGMHTLSLDRWFRRDEDYELIRDMPGHPMIKKRLFKINEELTLTLEEQKLTGWSCGPTAGQYLGPNKLLAAVEVSDQNLPKMAEHVMGGTPMLAGMFFVVAAIETLGGVPCTMTDVNMLNTCKIPQGLEERITLSTQLEKVATAPDSAYHFTVSTTPLGDFTMENATVTCTGRIFRNSDVLEALQAKTEEGEDGEDKDETPQPLDVETYGMDKYCMQAQLNLKDIGLEGLESLKAKHPLLVAKDHKEVYQILNIDGVRNWGPSFALAQSAHMSHDRMSLLAVVKSDCKGEHYTPQLLDCFVHLGILNPMADPNVIALNGGFERAHFVRVPGPGDLYVRLIFKPYLSMGRVKRVADVHAYDAEGRLIMWLEGAKVAFGGDKSSIKLGEMHWQPYSSTVNAQEVQAAAKAITDTEGPPKHCHDAMAELVSSVGLSKASRAVGETPDGSCVGVRVLLECNNDDCATLSQALLDALAAHDGLCKGDVIVELFTILRKPSLLAALDLKVASRAVSWLRYRRAVLPLGWEQLGDMAFDVIITSHIMQPPTQELQEAESSNEQQDKTLKLEGKEKAEDRVDETLTSLLTLASPGGVVLVHVHEPVKEKEEEEDKKDGEADEPSATAGAEATPEGTPEGTPEADIIEANGSVETKDEAAVQSTALATATEEKADLLELQGTKQVSGEEKQEVKAAPVMLVLPPTLRRACFHADEEVSTVSGDDGTLFVGRAPVPPIVRVPVTDKTRQQDQAQEEKAEKDAEQTSLQAQGEGEPSLARREVLLVADSVELAEQIKAQLLSPSSSQAVDDVHVLLCGPGSGLPLLDEADEEKQQASEKTVVKAWMDALREQVGPLACREIIFLAGMTDESPVAAVGYYRLLRLAKAIAKLQTPPQPQKEEKEEEEQHEKEKESEETDEASGAEEDKAEKTEKTEEEEEEPDVPGMEGSEEFEGPKVMWVVTKGCFNKHGVVIGQASLYAAARNLEVEVDDLAVRVADLADLQCLPRLASLVASQPRERYFRVDHHGDVLVQRFFVHTLGKTINTVNLTADDPKMAYGICMPYEDEYPIPGKVTVETRAWPITPPGDDEVTVRIHSAGVNFRDALMAMSLMPTESFENSFRGKCLGMEAAGTVVAVGKNVTDLKPGQAVWTSGSNSFGSLINAPKVLTYALPTTATFPTAATCQVAYATAHRGLVDMANVQKGETVLVHAAAGGVGMAAVSICQAYGATVYATASAAKRELVEQWGVDPSHIFDSRSYSWFKDVMRATKGQGVDIVFNSLAGKHQKLGIEALRTRGRFVEIGKIDVYMNASIGLMAMARNCSFIMVDIDELGKTCIDTSSAELEKGVQKVASGVYKALPCTTYAMGDAQEAMDHMKTGKHTGKILLSNYEDELRMVKPRRVQATLDHQRCCYKSEGVYLVTGAGGGFGSRIVRHAVVLGARTFVVSLTRDAESRVQALFGDLLQQYSDLTIHAVTADLSVKDDVARLVAVCRSLDQPLRSIIHCAGNPFDKTLHQLKRGDLEKLAGPKNMGAWWLHEMTLDMKSIENFAVVSSVAADLAARGFLVYGPTNAMLNSFVRYRQSLGLPACALNMATLCDVGIVADKPAVRQMQVAMGLEMLTSARASRDLIEVMMSGRQLLQLQLKHAGWSAIAHTFFHNITTTLTLGAQEAGDRRLAPEEALDFILQTVRDITKSDDVMPGDTLASVSIDSLSLMDLTSRVKRATGVDLPVSKLKATNSIADVADLVAERMRAMQGVTEAVVTAVQESTDAVAWVGQRVEEEVQRQEERAKRRIQMVSKPSFSVFEDETRAGAIKQKQDHVDSCLPLKFWRRKTQKGGSGDSSTEEDSVVTSSTSSSLTEDTDEMTPLKARQWFKTSFPNKDAERRLLVIPAAGRGTQQYSMWMLPGVEIVAVQIPGKEGREEEAPTMNLVEWGGKIARAAVFAGLLDDNKPLSVLGHSSGSVLALEMCRALQKHYNYTAQHLFVCSLQAPHLMSDLPGPLKKFFYKCCFNKTGVQTMIWMAGGTSRPVFLDKRSQQFIDGLWKQGGAVKEYSETHTLPLPAEDVLACPITVMWGEHDIVSNPKFGKRWWRDWDGYSQHKIRMQSFPGHHFFPFQPKLTPHVLQAIGDTIIPAKSGQGEIQQAQ